ncbi:MAG: hypothetical protein KDA57_11340 [Planctomycetales bacterium]|nr:hypothetical protein [Planctomycetales bacterium]
MEARIAWAVRPIAGVVLLLSLASGTAAQAAGYRTANFTVDAPTPRLAKEIGDSAEQWRSQLAQEWLGKQLPNWSKPCPIKAKVAPSLGAGGATSFVFDRGEVFGWRMTIQGSRERILDSVLPHEVTHTIFASHFREPLPRWADEGACTTVEHHSEIAKQESMLIDFLQTRRGIPFSHMFGMTEYPSDVMPLYAQGHSLAKFLIDQRGKREFLAFLADGMKGDWEQALDKRYGYANLLVLQNSWMDWIRQGRPQLQLAADAVLVASHESPIIRGQDPGQENTTRTAASAAPATTDPFAEAHTDSVVTDPWTTAVATATAAPATPTGPTAEQLWPAETNSAPQPPSMASVYDASRLTGTLRR